MSKLHTVITAPIDTEKAMQGTAKGIYTIVVRRDATKTEISEAIKKYYGVETESINTVVLPSKSRTIGRGKAMVKRPLLKKAVIKIKGGKALDFNKITV